MRRTIDDVRLCLDICNDDLEALGVPERLYVQSGYGSKHLRYGIPGESGLRDTGESGTTGDMYRVLDVLSDVLHLVRKARG